jgi:hypothetical protein
MTVYTPSSAATVLQTLLHSAHATIPPPLFEEKGKFRVEEKFSARVSDRPSGESAGGGKGGRPRHGIVSCGTRRWESTSVEDGKEREREGTRLKETNE